MEKEFLEWLGPRLTTNRHLRVGVGDDAAILQLSRNGDCVVTSDMLTEGVDFRLAEVDPRLIGRKSLAVNLSDLAAMACRPIAAIVALALPRQSSLELAVALYEGLLPLAEEFDLVIAGGDTNVWDFGLVVSITAIGEPSVDAPWLRSGARAGDAVLVTGDLGGSILGKHFDFQPRVREAMALNRSYKINAAADISDGLLLDLSRLASASNCGAVLNLDSIPVANTAKELAAADTNGGTPLEHALSDGEDFELLFTSGLAEAARLTSDQPLDVKITSIGRMVPEKGLWQATPSGERLPIEAKGFMH